MHLLPVLLGVAALAVLATCASASAYTVERSAQGAASGYIGYKDGKLPHFWQTTAPAAGGAVTTAPTAHAAAAPTTTSAVQGYAGFVNGRIPDTWVRTVGGGPDSTGPIEAPAPPKAAPIASAPETPLVPDTGAPVLPWILATIAFALVAAALATKVLASRRAAALPASPRV